MRNSSTKEYWKHYHHEQLLLQLIIDRNFYNNVWNFLAFSIFNTCLINTPHSLFPLGLWALASDPRKQEENVKTRIWNELFITDVLTHTHTLIQNEAFNAVETLQQWEDRELQHQVTKGIMAPHCKWRWSFISRTLFPTCSLMMWTSPPPC